MTFDRLAEIYDGWEIVVWKGFSPNKDKQEVTLEIVRKSLICRAKAKILDSWGHPVFEAVGHEADKETPARCLWCGQFVKSKSVSQVYREGIAQ